jgi:hypothetical protein
MVLDTDDGLDSANLLYGRKNGRMDGGEVRFRRREHFFRRFWFGLGFGWSVVSACLLQRFCDFVLGGPVRLTSIYYRVPGNCELLVQ